MLKKLPFKRPSQIQTGQVVKIIGKALHVDALQYSPVSNRACILYQTTVSQKRKKHWSTIIEETSKANFFIQSNDELVLVTLNQPKGFIDIVLDVDRETSSGFLNDANDRLELFLRKHHEQSTNIFGLNKSLKYEEAIIENKEILVVLGTATWKKLEAPIEGYSYSKILNIEGSATQKMIITDLKEAQLEKAYTDTVKITSN